MVILSQINFFSSVMFSYLPCVIQLIHAIVVEYGAEDLNLLRKNLKQMRIFYNIGLPESVRELLVKLESSAVDSIEEVEVSDEETESTDEDKSEQ